MSGLGVLLVIDGVAAEFSHASPILLDIVGALEIGQKEAQVGWRGRDLIGRFSPENLEHSLFRCRHNTLLDLGAARHRRRRPLNTRALASTGRSPGTCSSISRGVHLDAASHRQVDQGLPCPVAELKT